MTPLFFMLKYFWLALILVTSINWLILRKRARKHIEEDPQLAEGYAALLRGFLLWMNFPWVIMGIGCTVGGVPSVLHFFRPRDGNPYVLAWFGSVFLVWAFGTFWLFFRNGAETLAKYPGFIEFSGGFKSRDVTSPLAIKALWLLMVAGGIIGFVWIWSVDIAMPTFR